jgi:hypothetical protein
MSGEGKREIKPVLCTRDGVPKVLRTVEEVALGCSTSGKRPHHTQEATVEGLTVGTSRGVGEGEKVGGLQTQE